MSGTFIPEDQGVLRFACHFVANSTAKGCLAINQGVGVDMQPILLYKVVHKRSDSELTISSTLQGLPLGRNEIFLYEIEGNGLPGKYSAINTNVVSELAQMHGKFEANVYP